MFLNSKSLMSDVNANCKSTIGSPKCIFMYFTGFIQYLQKKAFPFLLLYKNITGRSPTHSITRNPICK